MRNERYIMRDPTAERSPVVRERMAPPASLEGCTVGVKYALAVGAVGAAIGIVVGVVNSTGLGFRLGFMVTNSALTMAEGLYGMISWIPLMTITVEGLTLFVSLILIAMTCILMGAGLPA